MKMFNEDDLLDLEFRKQVIAEITNGENVNRKREFLKRYEIYKDNTKKYVQQGLVNEGLRNETVQGMMNRGANISICRKIVNKLARTYSGGVSRAVTDDEEATKQINDLVKLLCFDDKMKKGDRYRELHKNCTYQIIPEVVTDKDVEPRQFKLKMRTLNPWQYDVIEDSRDKEVARAYVLSDFIEGTQNTLSSTEAQAGVHPATPLRNVSNNKDDVIADEPRDDGKNGTREFIWWSDKYHFTTDETGQIIPEKGPEDNLNPIEIKPFVNNAEDQDGFFWAIGGDDLIDGSVLVNKVLTDVFYIGFLQGFGQYVITGKNLPERITTGPNNALIFDYDPSKEDPQPTVSVVSANPQLDALMRSVEQYVALLLSTNNLSVRNVSTKLDVSSVASGIALLIEASEATDDISDKQKQYKDEERDLWEITRRWYNLVDEADEFTKEFKEIGIMPEKRMDVVVKFEDMKPVTTESEKLANLKTRKELGLNEDFELLMIDNPDLTPEDAQNKLKQIKEAKLKAANDFMVNSIKMAGQKENEEEKEDDEEEDDEE